MAARTYKRDSRGRFAGGGGGSSGGGSKAKAAAKPAKPATDGRRGPRGGKTGTRAEQRKAAAAQAARSAEFRGKATAGRGAKAAYKAAQGAARKAAKAPKTYKKASQVSRAAQIDRASANYKRATIAAILDAGKSFARIQSLMQVKNRTPQENAELSRLVKARKQGSRAIATAGAALERYGLRLGSKEYRSATQVTKKAVAGAKRARKRR